LALVLMVIAVNVGNLMSARISARTGELAVRTALGAGRARLVGQLTLEVLVLGLVSASIAWVGAAYFLSWLGRMVDDLPFWIGFDVGAADAMFLGATTLLVVLVGGGFPALRATRGDPAQALRRTVGGRTTLGPGPGGALAALEMCISVALIGAAVVTVRGFAGYARPDLGLPTDEILTVRVIVAAQEPPPGPVMLGIVDAARTVPGVRVAGISSALPGHDPSAPLIRIEGNAPEGDAPLRAPLVTVTPGFLEALDAEPIAGRLIQEADLLAGAPPVVVVNEPFVRRFLAGGNPLGRRIHVTDDDDDPDAVPEWREVVGVVPDLGMSLGDPAMAGGVYAPMDPLGGDASAGYLALRTRDAPGGYAQPIRQAVALRHPDALLNGFQSLDEARSDNAVALGIIGGGLTLIGGMALLLSLVSLYALTSFTIARRTREIGVRLALGGSHGSIARAILGRVGLSMGVGAVAGVALGALLLEARSVFVFRIPSGEPWLLPLVGVAMATAGALASWLPTRRALAIAPVEALRSE
jgi:predicted permease